MEKRGGVLVCGVFHFPWCKSSLHNAASQPCPGCPDLRKPMCGRGHIPFNQSCVFLQAVKRLNSASSSSRKTSSVTATLGAAYVARSPRKSCTSGKACTAKLSAALSCGASRPSSSQAMLVCSRYIMPLPMGPETMQSSSRRTTGSQPRWVHLLGGISEESWTQDGWRPCLQGSLLWGLYPEWRVNTENCISMSGRIFWPHGGQEGQEMPYYSALGCDGFHA